MCKHCEASDQPVSRRDLLRFGAAAAAMGTVVASPLRLFAGEEAPRTAAPVPRRGQAKQVVVLYMSGGASQFETFDPKAGTTNGGPTKAIATSVPGIHIADSLPLLAKRMDDLCLLRGMSSREGNHERARYLMHTGYPPTPTIVHAGIGSILSHEIGDPHAALPQYVSINGPGARPGYLGAAHAPFQVRTVTQEGNGRGGARPGANRRRRQGGRQAVENLEADLPEARRDRRLELLETLNEGFAAQHGDGVTAAQKAMFDRARSLMDTPKNSAFDLTTEKPDAHDRYGKHAFGQGCLMARRLLDEGVAVVEVLSNGWDTHDDNFNRVRALNATIDQGAAALIDDLKASGKLDETLIVWVGDFGRTPRITASQGRGHFPRAWSTWLAGGGVQGGRAIGATDANGDEVVERPVTVPDFFATIAHATGMDPTKTFHSNGRPIQIVEDGGLPIAEAFTA